MRTPKLGLLSSLAILLAAGPTSRPVNSLSDVESNYRRRAVAAEIVLFDELKSANDERSAGLQILLSRAMKSEDIEQAVAIKAKIDQAKGEATTIQKKADEIKAEAIAIQTKAEEIGKSTVFLCQASGSMLSCFGQVKQQLKESINNLDDFAGQQFNVVFFWDDQVSTLFKDGMKPASPMNKKLAMAFIDNIVSDGGDQPLPAVKFALSEKPEILCFLSDGMVTVTNSDAVIEEFKRDNPGGKTKINGTFFQHDNDPKMEEVMQQIVKDGRGHLKKISKDDI